MSDSMGPPAPRPCTSCPYRRDVPSGIWHESEYDKLRRYDADTASQPVSLFQCHQTDPGTQSARMCAGWVGCHGGQLLALRLASAMGTITIETAQAAAEYRSPVPLFESGTEAADHGAAEILEPGRAAVRAIGKITRRRSDIA